MASVVKTVPIRCGDCIIDSVRNPRRVGVIEVAGNVYVVATVRRDRRQVIEWDGNDYSPRPSGDRIDYVEPGPAVRVPCQRTHRGRKGMVVIDDDAVARALRLAGFDPSTMRRVSVAEWHRAAGMDPEPPPLPDDPRP